MKMTAKTTMMMRITKMMKIMMRKAKDILKDIMAKILAHMKMSNTSII